MYLECYGTGAPTVVLDGGLREAAGIWSVRTAETPPGPTVLPGVARFTRVCAYDRPGTLAPTATGGYRRSRSSPVPMPRTAADEVADLHTLLKVARVPGPYVFVGHSLGGLIDRLYAATYPRQVAGMVLVDALSEYMQGPLADIPLSVISKGLPFQVPYKLPGGLTRALLDRAWRIAQDKLAKLTPDAVHVIARRSSHNIMFTQPKLIIHQTWRVVQVTRWGIQVEGSR